MQDRKDKHCYINILYIILDKRVIQNTGYSRDVVQDIMNARQYGSRTV